MNLKTIFFLVFFTHQCFSQIKIPTKKTENITTHFNIKLNDEYTWLENTNSDEVKNWIKLQNEAAEKNYITVKKNVSTLETIKFYNSNSTASLPVKKGKFFYKMINIDSKKSPFLFMLNKIDAVPTELINPNKIHPIKNVNIESFYPSRNSNTLAYSLRIDGSDRLEIRFHDLIKNKSINDSLLNIKFSNISWNKDLGVFYKRNLNKSKFAKDSTYQLYYHRINTPQENDELIFDGSKKESQLNFFTSKTILFIIENIESVSHKNYYYTYLANDKFELIKFLETNDDSFNLINYYNGRIYYSTNKYNWGEVRSFDLKNTTDDKQIIPQFYNHLLVNSYFTDNYLICKYKTSGKTYLSIYNYDGKFIKKIETPVGTNIAFQNFDEETKDIYFGVSSYTIPFRNFKVNLLSGDPEQVFTSLNRAKPTVFPLDHFETKFTTYKNRENIDVPITIVYKKGAKLEGNSPCLLEAYGGFGMISGTKYDNGILHFLDKGGVYAYAEIRGGGEKGISWHLNGSGKNKINGLNDFIDASEYLIKEKYTNPKKLAITGASHGGLVVGYALTERPDLYCLALPEVGVFDMVNAHKYTVGKYHLDEYGNPEIEDDFKKIINFSPLHKIKPDVNYPATIIFTADNDDRVPPFHSYKFAASLQNREAQKNPVFLITKKNLGHYGGNTYQKKVLEDAEFYDYLIYYLMKQ